MGIPNFGVSTVIFNSVDISSRWWKLNFAPMWGQVKLHHFSDRIGMRQYFYFLHKFLRILSWKQLGQLIQKLIWIGCYLLNRTGLHLNLHNSCSIHRYLANFATNNINFWFLTQHIIIWPRKTGLGCITNCLIDNSRKSSYFPKAASTKNFCHT